MTTSRCCSRKPGAAASAATGSRARSGNDRGRHSRPSRLSRQHQSGIARHLLGGARRHADAELRSGDDHAGVPAAHGARGWPVTNGCFPTSMRLRRSFRREWPRSRIPVGSWGRKPSGDHLDARASRLSLSRRRHQQSHRADQARRRRSGLDRLEVLLGRAPMNPLRKAWDRWLGRGEASITTPPMDGAFRPNDLLDAALGRLAAPAPDGLAADVARAGRFLRPLAAQRRQAGRDAPAASFDAPRSARWPDCPTAARRRPLVDGRSSSSAAARCGKTVLGPEVGCITALAPRGTAPCWSPTARRPIGPSDWKRDLMEKNASGSVWRVEPASGARTQLAAIWPIPTAFSTRTPIRSSFRKAGAAR
jgi:hypothetical protein